MEASNPPPSDSLEALGQYDADIPLGGTTPPGCPCPSEVGQRFRSFGRTYECLSYNPKSGFWMYARADAENPASRLTNVSERAIGRTFHKVRNTDWSFTTQSEK